MLSCSAPVTGSRPQIVARAQQTSAGPRSAVQIARAPAAQEARRLVVPGLLAGLAAAQLAFLPGPSFAEDAPAPAAPAPKAAAEAPKPAASVAQAPALKADAADKPAADKPAAVIAEAPKAPAAKDAKEAPKLAATVAAAPSGGKDEVAVIAGAPADDVLSFNFKFSCSVEVKDVKAGAEPAVLEPKCVLVPAP